MDVTGTKKHAFHLLRYQNQREMARGQVIDRNVIERHIGLGALRCIREIQRPRLVSDTD
jgi:hypothetical protein